MLVKCATCHLEYDDTYRRTYCPHERFEMACTIIRRDGAAVVCTTVGQLMQEIEGRDATPAS